MKINIGKSNKRYSRDMSYDVNTTFGFGEVQPIMSQFMLPDSDINVDINQLVRLTPLIVPSFARVNLHTVSRFVPITEVFPAFESFLSNMPYVSSDVNYVPNSLPMVDANFMMCMVMRHCQWSFYENGKYNALASTEFVTKLTPVLQFLFGTSLSVLPPKFLQQLLPEFGNQIINENERLDLMSSDFVIKLSDTTMLFLRCTNRAARLRKVLVGLGYDMPVDNTQFSLGVSLLPCLCFYKAYFETYYPKRDLSFLQTKCYSLIDAMSNRHVTNLRASTSNFSSFLPRLIAFFDELMNCYYTSYDDYVSIHTLNPTSLYHRSNVLNVRSNDEVSISAINGDVPTLPSSSVIDNILLRSLRIFSNYVSKDSVIGQRMSEWVRTHFNATVSNQLFKDTHFVGRNTMPLQINDVFSTSDTAQGSGDTATGEHLGAYAGKGIGYGSTKFHYRSDVHGYFFIFCCVAPESRTFQGIDPTLLAVTRYELPTPEFDALGYEITDRRCIFGENGLLVPDTHVDGNQSFGYVPRYTGFKYKKNICNGQMSLRTTRDTMSPYYLDRDIIHNGLDPNGDDIVTNSIPKASTEWRFITRYPWLSNFNRIFVNGNSDAPDFNETDYDIGYDNFLGQMLLNVSLKDSLKPLKSSYDTFDASTDTDVSSVSAE